MDVLGLSSRDELSLATAISKLENASPTLLLEELKAMKAEFLKLVQQLKAGWRRDVEEALTYIDGRISPKMEKAPGWNNAALSD